MRRRPLIDPKNAKDSRQDISFSKLLISLPGYNDSWLLLIERLIHGKLTKHQIQQILMLNPNNFPLAVGKANCMLVQGYILRQKTKTEQANTLFSQALALYESERRENQCMHSITVLGYMHERGLGIPNDHQQAITYYERAVSVNNETAIKLLARKFHYGIGVSIDNKKAQHLLNQFADSHKEITDPLFIKIQAHKDQNNAWLLSTTENYLFTDRKDEALSTLSQLRNVDGLTHEQIYRIGQLFILHFNYEETARFFLNKASDRGNEDAKILLELLDNDDVADSRSTHINHLIDAIKALNKLLQSSSHSELAVLTSQMPYVLRFQLANNDSSLGDELADKMDAYVSNNAYPNKHYKTLLGILIALLRDPQHIDDTGLLTTLEEIHTNLSEQMTKNDVNRSSHTALGMSATVSKAIFAFWQPLKPDRKEPVELQVISSANDVEAQQPAPDSNAKEKNSDDRVEKRERRFGS